MQPAAANRSGQIEMSHPFYQQSILTCVYQYANPLHAFTYIYALLKFICVFAYISCVYLSLHEGKKKLPHRWVDMNSCSLRELAPCKAAAASSPANRFSLCHTGPCSLLCSRRVRPRLLRVQYTRPSPLLGNRGEPSILFCDLECTSVPNGPCHLEALRSCLYHSDS